MLRKLILLILSLLISNSAYAAIGATAVWEVRADAAGSNINGGFYTSGGTDYSQQTAAQYALTGVTSAGAGNTVLSASAATDMVGNGIKVVSGTNFTVSWFEITSVVAGVSITCSTNQAGASISTGVGATGVMNVGGAISLNTSGASGDDDVFEAGSAGNTWYFRQAAGNLSLAENVSIGLTGTAAAPIKFIGYTSTRSDAAPTGTNRPTIICAGFTFGTGTLYQVSNMIFTGTSSGGVSTGASKYQNCKSTNTATGANAEAWTAGTSGELINCEGISYRGNAVEAGGGGSSYYSYSWFHDSNVGINVTSAAAQIFIGNISSSNVTAAMRFVNTNTTISDLFENTLYGAENKTGVGLDVATGITRLNFINNIIYGFVTGVSNADAWGAGLDNYNDYNNNTADVNDAAKWVKGVNDITTAPSFTSATQVVGTTAVILSGNRIQDTSKNFTTLGVVANATPNIGYTNYAYYSVGTGAGVKGIYAITAITTVTNTNDTITVDLTLTADATTDHGYQITVGDNYLPTATLAGFPGAFQGAKTTGYQTMGAVQKSASSSSTDLLGVIQ